MVEHRVARGIMKRFMKLVNAKGFTSPWKVIYYKDVETMADIKTRRHELTHIAQYEREGTFTFIVKYLLFNATVGYRDNPYEREARASETIV